MRLFGVRAFPILNFILSFLNLDGLSFNATKDVRFLLRVRNRPFKDEEVFQYETLATIEDSAFDPSKPTTLLIHGFLEDRRAQHHLKLSMTLLNSEDQNLFFVDWGLKKKIYIYPIARRQVNEIAKIIAAFIEILFENAGLKYNTVTLIGFSLGAHIAGMTGKYLTNDKIKKIIGLDPAGPMFNVSDIDNRLSSDSAMYTECLHTGAPIGIREPICQADFYINSGSNQPQCPNDLGTCSHQRAVEIYIESLKNPKKFYGDRCLNLDDALKMNCIERPGAFINDPANEVNKLSGIFHVITEDYPSTE